MILALDTSTAQASVALAEGERLLGEWSWTAGGNHSRHLMRLIRELLAVHSVGIARLGAVVVAVGPGSFSGVRVAISAGKGLAMARGVPLVGIGTLDVIGYQASAASPEVWAVLSAGRSGVYLAHYRGQGESWGRVGDYALAALHQAVDRVSGDALVAGEAALRPEGRAAGSLQEEALSRGIRLWVQPPVEGLRRAGYLAELGTRYLERGGGSQLDTIEPLYLRRSAAEEKRAAESQE
jgi:tRNA threonylcarbamoyladenosine biosynthesis protein TsaB